jgi:hypothetical protein
MKSMSKTNAIDDVREKVEEALASGAWFEAEHLADRALAMAHKARDFERMAKLVDLLLHARQERLDLAFESGTLTIVRDRPDEDAPIEPGCYLIEPPLVGADGRRMSLAALQSETPVTVLCREPRTRLGLWPVVAICPGLTVRTQVPPPDDEDAPDLAWFAQSMLDLGDWSLQMLDPSLPITRRVDALLQRLDALPEHQGLHEALIEACEEAAQEGE